MDKSKLLNGSIGNILEMAKEDRREKLTEEMDRVTTGHKADDIVIVALLRIESIAKQPDAPRPFKMSVIAMLAGLIVDLSR